MTAVDRVDYSSSNSSDSLNKTGVSWRGRAVRYARMAPALFCLILTVIGACSAVFSSMPWMCIPFLVGSIASGYLMHLAGKFDQHKSLGSALGKMKTWRRPNPKGVRPMSPTPDRSGMETTP